MKYIFQIDGDNLRALTKDMTVQCSVMFTAQVSHYENLTALHKLISIVLQLANQIRRELARANF